MNENSRFEEYKAKVALAREQYSKDFHDLMERRKNNTMLDEGAQEEIQLRKTFNEKMHMLKAEYSDLFAITS